MPWDSVVDKVLAIERLLSSGTGVHFHRNIQLAESTEVPEYSPLA